MINTRDAADENLQSTLHLQQSNCDMFCTTLHLQQYNAHSIYNQICWCIVHIPHWICKLHFSHLKWHECNIYNHWNFIFVGQNYLIFNAHAHNICNELTWHLLQSIATGLQTSQLWSDTVGELGQYSHPCHQLAARAHTSTPILFDPLPPIILYGALVRILYNGQSDPHGFALSWLGSKSLFFHPSSW